MSSADDGLVVARRRRRIRAAVVLTLAAVLVMAGLFFALQNISTPSPSSSTAPTTPSCTPSALPQASSELNVYNASGGSGSAKTVAQKFAAGGFDVGVVSNDPYKAKLDVSAQIRFGTSGEAFAKKYVLPLVPDARLSPDGRTDSSVDVVLGKEFSVDVPPATAPTSC